MKLISRYVTLENANKSFGFSVKDPSASCMPGNITYHYEVIDNSSVVVWFKSNQANRVTVPSSNFKHQKNFLTTYTTNKTNDVCARWRKKLSVDANCKLSVE